MSENIAEFNVQVLRAVAALYKSHPTPIDLGFEVTHSPPPSRNDADYDARVASSGGTITWLHRNGFVSGKYLEGGGGALMLAAQLSGSAYRVISRPEQNAAGKILGTLAVDTVAQPNDHDMKIVSEIMVRRLLGT